MVKMVCRFRRMQVYNIGNQNPENLLDFVCGPVIDREKTEDGNYAFKRIGKESG